MYRKDILRDYVKGSEIREYSDSIKVRLSKELAEKYDNGVYDNYLHQLQEDFDLVGSLNITLPGRAKPTFYLYIVPDDNYYDYLNTPPAFRNGGRGGKPVPCYDIDGFNSAYGISQNIAEEFNPNVTIARRVNNAHEVAHIFQHQFYSNIPLLGEGFAETISLYGLDLEDNFEEHKELLRNLKEEDILSAKELIDQTRAGKYGEKELIPNKTCSFRESYLSSYLFVRGIIETIKDNEKCSKEEAIQLFLELIKNIKNNNEYMIYDIADYIHISPETLLFGKDLQTSVINNILGKEIAK